MTGLTALGILLAHLFGDYVVQSSWMAVQKVRWWPAVAHGLTYGLCYCAVTLSWQALLVIAGTHIVIDRYRLATWLVWAKNQLVPEPYRYRFWDRGITGHGYVEPNNLVLMWVADNAVHLLINTTAVALLTYGAWRLT